MSSWARRTGVLLVLGPLLALLPYVGDAYWQQLGYRALQLYALASVWNLLAGIAGQTSLGVAAFVGCGAYTMASLVNATRLPPLLLVPACGGAALLLAALLSRPMFRLRGLYFTIGTLAATEALRIVMVNTNTFGGASGLIVNSPSSPSYVLYWAALLLAIAAELAVQSVLALPLSLSMRGVRDDEDVARQMGVRTFQVKLVAFAISAFFTGAVGGLQALKLGVIEPYGAFGFNWTIDTVAAVIIGGLGSAAGPLIGTVLYVGLGEALRSLPEVHSAVAGVIVLGVIRLAPQGIAGLLARRLRRSRAIEIVGA